MFKLRRVVWPPPTITRLHFSVHSSSRQKSNGNYFGRRYSLRTDGARKTLTIWIEYKAFISFVDVGGADASYRDPKDAPYIKLQKEIGALIYSRDKHIKQMNGLVVNAAVVASLRIYSRQVVIEYVLKAGGTGCLCVTYGLLKLLIKFIHAMFAGTKRIPKKFWMTAFVILLGVLLYPPSRRYLINSINSLGGRAKSLGVELLKQFGDLVIEHEIAKTNASAALVSANNGIDAALK